MLLRERVPPSEANARADALLRALWREPEPEGKNDKIERYCSEVDA